MTNDGIVSEEAYGTNGFAGEVHSLGIDPNNEGILSLLPNIHKGLHTSVNAELLVFAVKSWISK